jgi:BlaI family penicillinase repressor
MAQPVTTAQSNPGIGRWRFYRLSSDRYGNYDRIEACRQAWWNQMMNKRLKASRGKCLPTASELRLLQILWDKGEGSVEDIVNAHQPRNRPNYKTTQTLLRIMEEKGFIAHENRGRVFVFAPLISRKAIDKMSIQNLLSQNFGGSPTGLFVNLLDAAKMKEKDLDELEAQIREYRKKNELNAGGRS